MKSLVQFIKESLINEGGNAVTANPIPAYITPLLYKEIEDSILKENPDIKMVPLGSVGKKNDDQFNGDIDIAIKLDNKKELSELIDKVFPDLEKNPNTTPSIVSISYPYNKEGKSGNAQVDFMIVKDIDFAKFFYHSPDFKKNESKFKGATRAKMLSIIVSSIPVEDAKDEYFEDGKTVKKHWKYTFNTEGVFRQLLDYTGKKGPLKNPKKVKEFEKLIVNDPDNCIKFIFGDNGKIEDCNSAESLWKAVHDKNKFKFQDVVKKIEDRWFDEIEELKDKREFFENL